MPVDAQQLTVSELFVSVQGEGPSTGKPAAFVRLGNCNLECSYCDTPYTWDFTRFDAQKELRRVPLNEVLRFLLEEGPGRVVITGGEPLIQQKVLGHLIGEVDRCAAEKVPPGWAGEGRRLVVEVETNGTIRPTAELAARVDQWNVSPKLSASGESAERRLKSATLTWFSLEPRAFFKFVVRTTADVDEAVALVRELGVPNGRVLLMPMAKDRAELEERDEMVREWAKERGLAATTRLHLKLWDGVRGH